MFPAPTIAIRCFGIVLPLPFLSLMLALVKYETRLQLDRTGSPVDMIGFMQHI